MSLGNHVLCLDSLCICLIEGMGYCIDCHTMMLFHRTCENKVLYQHFTETQKVFGMSRFVFLQASFRESTKCHQGIFIVNCLFKRFDDYLRKSNLMCYFFQFSPFDVQRFAAACENGNIQVNFH